MRAGNRSIAMIAISLFVVIGCGGTGGGAAVTTGPGSLEPNAASGLPSTAPVASQKPAASQGSTGGGGLAGGVCGLVTADELAGLFNVASVKTSVLAGPPDTCIVQSDTGNDLTAWTLSTTLAKGTFDAMTTDPTKIDVSGIGDKAAIVQNTGLLVLKGDALLVITISGGADRTEDEAIVIAKQIAAIAVGRM